MLIYANVKLYTTAKDKKNYQEWELKEDDVNILDLQSNYKIISISEIGNKMSAIVLEDMVTHQVRFLRAYYNEAKGKRLKLVQLGIYVNSTQLTKSPLLKYRSMAKIEPSTGKHYQVGLVLRKNGRFEVYSDFMLVNEYMNPHSQCVDIETDFNQFYLKFVNNCEKITHKSKFEDLSFELR